MGRDNRAHKQTRDLPSRHHCAPCDRLSMYSCTTVMFSTYLFYNGYTELVEIGCFCSLFYMTIIEHINKLETYLADITVHCTTAARTWVLLCFLHTYSIIAVPDSWTPFWLNILGIIDHINKRLSMYPLYVRLLWFLHAYSIIAILSELVEILSDNFYIHLYINKIFIIGS